MCGICGVFSFSSLYSSPELLREMLLKIEHRGPDGEGLWENNQTGLGHRRLSIIDLSENGKQPMTNEDGSLWLTYNGEIYNYIDLRKELQKKGHIFSSDTDSEVILHAYEEYGVDCLHKFNGMFAFALYDSHKKALFCARDRFGIKPFYYHQNDERFLFASEIKALLCDPHIPRRANDPIIFDYLVFNRCDFCEETFFQDIYRLSPGHSLWVDREGVKKVQWWKNTLPPENSEANFTEKFFQLLENSVHLRLRSDVPVGSCLSGGLDSSTIVSLMKRISPESTFHTFSAVYDPNWKFDERRFMEAILETGKLQGHFTEPSGDKLEEDLEKLIYAQDEPFGTSAIYAQWEVMKLAQKKGLKVLLDGQGSDEALAGYHYFFGFFFYELLREKKWGKCFQEMLAYAKRHQSALGFQTFFFLLAPDSLRRKALGTWKSHLSKDFFREQNGQSRFYESFFQAKTLNECSLNHFNYKLEHLLRYEDRNSMAFSIESRVPFLDHNLIEYALSLPSSTKIYKGESKKILRQAMKPYLPEMIVDRQDKIGFATPEQSWFRQPNWENRIREIISSSSFQSRPYFDSAQVQKHYEDFLAGKHQKTADIWKWINLELWLRRFIDAP